MSEVDLVTFTLEAIKSGVIGNAAYDGIKLALGGVFSLLKCYADNNDTTKFKKTLDEMLQSNDELKKQLLSIQQNPRINNIQNAEKIYNINHIENAKFD